VEQHLVTARAWNQSPRWGLACRSPRPAVGPRRTALGFPG
jgi:hypothetical protein